MDKVSQVIRLPKKYAALIDSMSHEEAGKLIKNILGYPYKLEGLSDVYYKMMSVDLMNLENSGMNGGKGGRPKRALKKEAESMMDEMLEGMDEYLASKVRNKIRSRGKEGLEITRGVIENVIESLSK